jgi:hypothetical protein
MYGVFNSRLKLFRSSRFARELVENSGTEVDRGGTEPL